MARFENPLSHVKVASPCSADWENMIGNDRRRFCGQCELNVYNLSDMTKREAEELINQTEGRLCVRFYRRADGTILTNNCPVGLRAAKQRLSKLATTVVSFVLGFVSGSGFNSAVQTTGDEQGRYTTMGVITARELPVRVNDSPFQGVDYEVVGKMAPIEPKSVRTTTKSHSRRSSERSSGEGSRPNNR